MESVDRSKIVSVSSIMLKNPVLARFPKEGPAVVIRNMRQRNLTSLPVVNDDRVLIGEVHLKDLMKLRNNNERSIESAIRTDNLSVTPDTVIEELLPLLTKTNSPITIVDEDHKVVGLLPLHWLVIEMTGMEIKEINEIIENSQV